MAEFTAQDPHITHMERPIILLAAVASLILACSNEKPATASQESTTTQRPAPVQFGGPEKRDSLFLSLERTSCFGTCKAYRIDLYRSGFATFDGKRNMEKEGRHSARIGMDTLRVILEKAEALGFNRMQDVYDGDVTDLPSTHLQIVANGRDKRVMGRVGQPTEFKQLVAYVEELLLPVPWKPVVAQP